MATPEPDLATGAPVVLGVLAALAALAEGAALNAGAALDAGAALAEGAALAAALAALAEGAALDAGDAGASASGPHLCDEPHPEAPSAAAASIETRAVVFTRARLPAQ